MRVMLILMQFVLGGNAFGSNQIDCPEIPAAELPELSKEECLQSGNYWDGPVGLPLSCYNEAAVAGICKDNGPNFVWKRESLPRGICLGIGACCALKAPLCVHTSDGDDVAFKRYKANCCQEGQVCDGHGGCLNEFCRVSEMICISGRPDLQRKECCDLSTMKCDASLGCVHNDDVPGIAVVGAIAITLPPKPKCRR